MRGMIIAGGYGNILVREKAGEHLELGELLTAKTSNNTILLQVIDLLYGSQLSQQHLELVSGLQLEEDNSLQLMDKHLRNYVLARLKSIATITNGTACTSKQLPPIFTTVHGVTKEDLLFLATPPRALPLGNIRSGTNILDTQLSIDAKQALTHHILITGTTGRGKSYLLNNIIWHLLDKNYAGILILDPHDEYYGRNHPGMKDHPAAHEKLIYYTPNNPPPGARTLKININKLKPQHFQGAIYWTDPQQQALTAYYKKYKQDWIRAILLESPLEQSRFFDMTLAVVKRRLLSTLSLDVVSNHIISYSIFDNNAGDTTIQDIVTQLTTGNTVIIDTSSFSGSVEILIGSMIAHETLREQKKNIATLHDRPAIAIILEEAPRVLGKEVLEQGQNIFNTIAREGRKFNIGLCAVTQLPSLIPRQVLANMNTKIILGTEMKLERQAIIESASQDLSDDDRTIASLDKGEAIVTSNFTKFATPIKISDFKQTMKNTLQQSTPQKFTGI